MFANDLAFEVLRMIRQRNYLTARESNRHGDTGPKLDAPLRRRRDRPALDHGDPAHRPRRDGLLHDAAAGCGLRPGEDPAHHLPQGAGHRRPMACDDAIRMAIRQRAAGPRARHARMADGGGAIRPPVLLRAHVRASDDGLADVVGGGVPGAVLRVVLPARPHRLQRAPLPGVAPGAQVAGLCADPVHLRARRRGAAPPLRLPRRHAAQDAARAALAVLGYFSAWAVFGRRNAPLIRIPGSSLSLTTSLSTSVSVFCISGRTCDSRRCDNRCTLRLTWSIARSRFTMREGAVRMTG